MPFSFVLTTTNHSTTTIIPTTSLGTYSVHPLLRREKHSFQSLDKRDLPLEEEG
ncbi:unnamed protein product, partial [Ectocarpus sp. 12 AP-2014]